MSNAYLILAKRPILVDTGSPGDLETLRSRLRLIDIEFSDLSLILHTHIHSDHMGCTVDIAAECNCPIAFHAADQPIVDRSHNGTLSGVGLRGRVMSRLFSDVKFRSMHADVELQDGMRLDEFGVDATVLATPGHTPGSISIVASEGDAIIGDLLMGGYMGGAILPSKPNYHYFADDLNQVMSSLDRVLSQTTGTLYVGHGGPLLHPAVCKWRGARQSLAAMS